MTSLLGECRTYTDRIYTHAHDFAQLVLPLEGCLSIATAQHQLELTEAQLFFLPPACEHTFHACQANQCLVLDIPSSLAIAPTAKPPPGGLTAPLDDRWRALRSLLLVEASQGAAANLTHLVRYGVDLLRGDRQPRSIQHIHTHYYADLNLQHLAALEGYSLTYYCEWFKRHTGQTPSAYLRQVRLQQAEALLQHTDLSILQIAQQVGYEHHASLTRLFLQHRQQTPSAYRQHSRRLDKPQPNSG